MLKRFAPALVVGLAMASAFADTQSDIKALYANYAKALKSSNFPALEKMLSPKFSVVEGGKTYNREQALGMMKQNLSVMKFQSISFKFGAFKAAGANTVVTVSEAMVLKAPNPQTKKESVINVTSTSEDTWTKSGKSWLLLKSATKSQKVTVDGKVVPQPK